MKDHGNAIDDSDDSNRSMSSSFSVRSFASLRSDSSTRSNFSTRTGYGNKNSKRNADTIAKDILLTREEKDQAIADYKKDLPPFHLDSLKFICAKDEMPEYDVENIANLIIYNEVYAKVEQPTWRKELIKKFGPTGVQYFDYGPLSSAVTWRWDVDRFGDWSMDSKRDLTFNGHKFMLRHSDGMRRSIALEEWLKKKALKRDAKALDDSKWVHKKIYIESILQREVSIKLHLII